MRIIRLWFGIALVVLGVLGIADAFDAFDGGQVVKEWWPLAVVSLGLALMIAHRRASLGPVAITVVGLALLAGTTSWTETDILGPALLTLLGGALIVDVFRIRTWGKVADTAAEGQSTLAVFGGSTVKNRSEHFHHADASAVFGGATLDLRESHIDREASVDAFAFCGGVDVLVPKTWRVKLTGIPVFAAQDDKTTGNADLPADAPTLTVNATAVLGGVTVANAPAPR